MTSPAPKLVKIRGGGPHPLPDGVEPCSDLGNAHRLLDRHGRDLYHCGPLGWHVWTGQCWAPDETGEVFRRAHHIAKAERLAAVTDLREAEAADDERAVAKAKRRYAWATKTQGRTRIDAMLSVGKSLDGIAIRADAFDNDPDLFACANGTIDLSTGELREHRREDLLTKLSPVSFDPEAEAPVFGRFLERIFDGNGDLIAFIQRWTGYSLTGLTAEQAFAILHGSGANGKSTLLEIIRYVAGAYGMNTGADTLMTSRGRGPDNDIARLRGARFVSASESGEARQLDEERIKRLSGEDTLTARFLYKEAFEFRPTFKLWLATNHRPKIKGTDEAIWRRVLLVPFDVFIPPAERDPELGAKLRAEAAGILRWAVEGELDRRANGLRPPEAVRAATEEYRAEENVLGRFIEDECVMLPEASVTSGALYERYVDWCKSNGEEPINCRSLGKELARDSRLEAKRDGRRGRYWRGIGLVQTEGGDV